MESKSEFSDSNLKTPSDILAVTLRKKKSLDRQKSGMNLLKEVLLQETIKNLSKIVGEDRRKMRKKRTEDKSTNSYSLFEMRQMMQHDSLVPKTKNEENLKFRHCSNEPNAQMKYMVQREIENRVDHNGARHCSDSEAGTNSEYLDNFIRSLSSIGVM